MNKWPVDLSFVLNFYSGILLAFVWQHIMSVLVSKEIKWLCFYMSYIAF